MSKEVSQQFLDDFSKAERLTAENRFNESLDIYMSLLKDHPDHIPVLNNLGLVHEKLGDFEKAVGYYEKCDELAPNQVVLMNNLANAYTRVNRWADAQPILQKLVTVDFQNESNTEKYALCLFNTSPKEDAKKYIQSVISKYPDNARLNRLLGRSLMDLDAHMEALVFLRRGSGFIEFDADGVTYLN